MNLLDKYIAEVGKYLPRNQRADIEAEIRSTLEDMLEERNQAGASKEAEVVAVLKEYGSPREVAASYTKPRYLIGPLMYPRLEFVSRIVLIILFVLFLAAFGFSVIYGEMTILEISKTLVNFLVSYIVIAIIVLGITVLISAVFERVLPKKVISGQDEKWNPKQLAK